MGRTTHVGEIFSWNPGRIHDQSCALQHDLLSDTSQKFILHVPLRQNPTGSPYTGMTSLSHLARTTRHIKPGEQRVTFRSLGCRAHIAYPKRATVQPGNQVCWVGRATNCVRGNAHKKCSVRWRNNVPQRTCASVDAAEFFLSALGHFGGCIFHLNGKDDSSPFQRRNCEHHHE